MPELPEVQTVVNDLTQKGLIGETILKALVSDHRAIATPSVSQFVQELEGKKILGIHRRAKYIVIDLTGEMTLYVHLRMTGRFLLEVPKELSHIHVTLLFSNGFKLYFHDTRKFGRWSLVNAKTSFIDHLGPEPLEKEFTSKVLYESLQKTKRHLKSVLLDQSVVAGLGNIYVDEALFEAGLHPLIPAHSISKKQASELHQAIQTVLKRGLEARGTTLGSGKSNFYRLSGERGNHATQLQIFRKTGEPCPKCGRAIEKIRVAQRSTHFCSTCQKTPVN